MKKVIPFKKEIIFKTNLSEIVSISLEHSLHLEQESLITGEFIISGEYKMADMSVDTEKFSFNLPFDINIDEKYLLNNITVDIDDFYYEIINNNVLSVNIEVLIDKIEEKKIAKDSQVIEKKTVVKEVITNDDLIDRQEKEENVISNREQSQASNEIISTIFDDLDESRETYATYQIYIVRESDNLELILQKYNITKDDLEQYNDIKELKIGDKLIIPQQNNAKNK
ncbi:MAG: LysM peptidoglycan-binding domain-containing protein [Bacilli bacterium]